MKRKCKYNIKIFIAILLGLVFLEMARITAQVQLEESWIPPKRISSGLTHAYGILANDLKVTHYLI